MYWLLPDLNQREKQIVDDALATEINCIDNFIKVANILPRLFLNSSADICQKIHGFFYSHYTRPPYTPITPQEYAVLLMEINQFCHIARTTKKRLDKQLTQNVTESVFPQLIFGALQTYLFIQTCFLCNTNSQNFYVRATSYTALALTTLLMVIGIALIFLRYNNSYKHETWMRDNTLRTKHITPCESNHPYILKLKEALNYAKVTSLIKIETAQPSRRLLIKYSLAAAGFSASDDSSDAYDSFHITTGSRSNYSSR